MLRLRCLVLLLTLLAIVDGKQAPLGKYVHNVSIRYNGEHICSGSIINQRHILTSSSCIIGTSIKDLTVVAGTNSLRTGGDSYKVQKKFTPDSSYDDIAILRTQNDINFHRGVQKIPLDNHNLYAINSPLTVLGWERPPQGQIRQNMMLQEFAYRLYDQDLCRMESNLFGRQFLCIVDPAHRSICNMDHGGGIISDGYLLGIYLNRGSCLDGHAPKAHTPVYEYMNWINANSELRKNRNPIAMTDGRICPANHDAPHGVYKHHVSVRYFSEPLCSGTIINQRFILTSQLCVIRYSARDLTIIAGTDSLTIPGVSYEVEKIISHPGDDDYITLLQTIFPIKFNSMTHSIPLTQDNYDNVGQRVVFTAFERPTGTKLGRSRLQAFEWEIYNLKECGKYYNDVFDNSSICTMDPCHEDTCNIDHGGAVVANGVMIGMKYYPEGCTSNIPVVHHRIHHYLTWIKQNSDISKLTRFSNFYKPVQFGNNSPAREFSYHVSIRRHNQHICSGSIINRRTVLTSYNCILSDKAENLFVIAGSNSLTRGGASYAVKKIIPTYDKKYDIAILHTTANIFFNDAVQPIHISTDDHYLYDSASLTLTGWEHDANGIYKNDELQQISYQKYNLNLCKQVIPFLSEAYMCSINPSHERACFMDSGGPIVVNGVQVALNPFGVRCESNNGPHLYLPLHKHSAWIQRNTAM